MNNLTLMMRVVQEVAAMHPCTWDESRECFFCGAAPEPPAGPDRDTYWHNEGCSWVLAVKFARANLHSVQ